MQAARRAKLAAVAIAALAVPAGMVISTSGTASANAPCGKAGQNYDPTVVNMTAGVSANMRSGSSTSCAIKGWADNQDSLDYYCWTGGENGTWTYLYNRHDGTYGWVKDSLLPGYGAEYACDF
ncbi:SH3 domain-containing protein [Streptomyces sp. NPDC005065]|uniref:SH3 domain-containing protein n=1 Tax=Streptomyces sp. NPDC005065 TaxID=3154461 RepID=UPI0033A41287